MPTYYLDFENGNDANDGLSFANRWKTLSSGATSARIAPGDVIRVMASPAATSLGINGTWTSQAQQATQAITSSTNATPIVITRASHGLSTGDTVVITGHTTNTNANGTWTVTSINSSTFSLDGSVGNGVGGTSGTFRRVNSMVVTLASAVTQTIASTGNIRSAWTASANVTATLDTTSFKEGSASDSIAIAAGFTTGLAAYFATGTLNLSGYQQVSFWIRQTSGTLATSGQITLRLCSDTVGAVTVDTITVPAIGALNTWQCVTVNTGAALGASIQSVALYVATDVAAQTFLLSNIIACKATSAADSLNLESLIGKNDGQWFPIMSINGTRVMLGAPNAVIPTSSLLGGYHGTSESVTTWKREPIERGSIAGAATIDSTLNDNGTSGNVLTFSGGWNRTDMSTQTDETWLLSTNGNGIGLIANRNWIHVEKINFVGWATGISVSSAINDSTYSDMKFAACSTGANFSTNLIVRSTLSTILGCCNAATLVVNASHSTLNGVTVIGGGSSSGAVQIASRNATTDGITVRHTGDAVAVAFGTTSTSHANGIVKNVTVTASAGTTGVQLANNHNVYIETMNITGGSTNSTSTGVTVAGQLANTRIKSLTTSGHATQGVAWAGQAGELVLLDASIAESTEFTISSANFDAAIYSQNHDSGGQSLITTDGGTMGSTNSVRNTASGIAWYMSPTASTRDSVYPLRLPLARILVGASTLVTVKAYLRRTNTALTLGLVCKGNQIAGVANDVRANMTALANLWEEVTITFTPSEAGFVEISAEAYGGTTHTGYIDDLTITQA